jgi:hypothetical protein
MNFKYVLAFVTGAAAGAGGMYLYLKKDMEKKLNDEIAEVRRYYSERYTKKFSRFKDLDEPTKYSDKPKEEPVKKSGIRTIDPVQVERAAYKLNKDRISYSGYGKKKPEAEPETPTPETAEEDVAETTGDKPVKYPIDSSEVGATGYDIDQLTYYAVTDDLINDYSGNAVDLDEELGSEAEKYIENTDVGCAFFWRNEKLKTDYEIEIVGEAYEQ